MPSEKFLEDIHAQECIDKFVKIAKNKKILLYGAGCFAEKLVLKYDLSNLNIIGITDKKFENDTSTQAYFNFKTYKPSELNELDFDILFFSVLSPRHLIKQIKKDKIITKRFKTLYFKKSFWKNLYDLFPKRKKSNERCMICNNNHMSTYFATIAPFLIDLMFDFKEKNTELLYCPNCKISYFKLRPNDEQIGRYYNQYASEMFKAHRSKYEASLYKTLSTDKIYSPDLRKIEMKNNISAIGCEMKNFTKILDYGGSGSLFSDDFSPNIVYSYNISIEETPNQPNFINNINKIEKNSFDFIATTHVLEHLVNPRQAVSEMFSFLKKGGFLYVEVPDETGLNNDVGLLSQLFGNSCFQMHEHINIFKKKTLSHMLKSLGFKVLKCKSRKYPSSFDYRGYIWCLAKKE